MHTSPGPVGELAGRAVASAPPPKVTATARVPVRFLPLPRRRGAGRPRPGQVVAVQVAALAVVAAAAGPAWLLPVAGAGAVGTLAVVCGRRNGRWWFEAAARRRRFGARRYRFGPGRPAGPAASLSVAEVEVRGSQFGVGLDDAGWFAAFAIVPPPGMEAERRLIEVVDRLGQILAETDAPVSALQLVHHTVPAATATTPAGQWLWVALRLDPADAAAASAARGGGVPGVHRALAAAVGRVQKTLRAAGLAYHRALTADELAAAVGAVGGAGPGASPAPGAPTERWHALYGPDAAHVCFRLSGSPAYSLSHLVAGLSRCAVSSFTVSVRLHARGGDGLSVAALLRVATASQPLPATVREVTALAARFGLDLARLDGEHATAAYAAAPTALAPPT